MLPTHKDLDAALYQPDGIENSGAAVDSCDMSENSCNAEITAL
jgi:hypothetical protein